MSDKGKSNSYSILGLSLQAFIHLSPIGSMMLLLVSDKIAVTLNHYYPSASYTAYWQRPELFCDKRQPGVPWPCDHKQQYPMV